MNASTRHPFHCLERFAALWLLVSSIALPAESQAQRPDEIGAGMLLLRASPVEVTVAPGLETEVSIDVTGMVARVTVSQRFRNAGPDWVEGVYVFPLPADAAVDRLTLLVGDRRIEGEIQERAAARRIYERARAAGQQASLVEQERPNLFTTSVANIAPSDDIVIEIGYLQTVAYDQGRFSLRFPMTLTPRYVPGSPLGTARGDGWSDDTAQVPDASRVTPPVLDPVHGTVNAASVAARIDAGLELAEIASPSHALRSTRDDTRYAVTLDSATVPMDRDFILEWRLVPGSEPRAVAFTEQFEGESYVLLMFLPPAAAATRQSTLRELIFVIDTSGSMGGPSIEQAQAALRAALAGLGAGDRFNVIEFNSTTRPLFIEPAEANAQTLGSADRFVEGLHATGGTEMMPAVLAALKQPTAPGYLRQIVFITDGAVGNEAVLFEAIHAHLDDARLFTIGIGAAPNSHFMRKAAEFGRGSFLHIGRLEEVATQMEALLGKLEHVAMTDIALDWPEAAEVYPERVPDLYHGEPVVVAARLHGLLYEPLALETRGRVGRLDWSQRIGLGPDRAPGVATVWARRKVEALLDSRLEGREPDAIRQGVIDMALRHGLVSPFTSLVAVDRTPQRSREAQLRRQAVPNMLPAGTELGAIFGPLPQTATDAPLMRLLGTALAALVLGLVGIRRLVR